MAKFDLNDLRNRARKNEDYIIREKNWTNRIVKVILITLLLLIVVVIVGGYLYVTNALSPVDEQNTETVEITVPIGSSSNEIAIILQENGIIHNAEIFRLYMRSQNLGELQAGYYDFNQAMDADQVISVLNEGGEPILEDIDTNLTVIEGMQIEEIATMVSEQTPITEEEFMEVVNDEEFIAQLTEQFPSMLEGLMEIEGLKYPLEGYLFPATYDYISGMTATDLITQMVSTMNLEYQSIREDLDQTWLSLDRKSVV